MIEHVAIVYRYGRKKGFIANCMAKNIVGFGRTEEDAINNLKVSLEKITNTDVIIKPMYNLLLAQ